MKIAHRVLVGVLCLLVLASAATAALTRMTKAELQDLIKRCLPAAGAEATPGDYLKSFPALGDTGAVPVSATTISTDKAYGAILLETGAISSPNGLGVGELGDYVLINDYTYGDIWRYRNGAVKYLLTPSHHHLAAGRMCGRYYFGDYGGNVFRLEPDGSVTTLFDLIDGSNILVTALAVEPTTGLLAFTVFSYVSPVGTLLVVMDPADPGAGFQVYYSGETVSGLDFRGNYLYVSSPVHGAVIRYNWRSGAGPYIFASNLEYPGPLQFDPKGNLFVVDKMKGAIIRFNASATGRQKIAWGFLHPNFFGLDKRGDVFVIDQGKTTEVWKIRKKQ